MVTITNVNFLPVTFTILILWCARKQNTSPVHDNHQRSFDFDWTKSVPSLSGICWESVHCRLVLNSLSWISKLIGSIPDEVIGFFSWPNPAALGLTTSQPSESLDRLLQGQFFRLMHFKNKLWPVIICSVFYILVTVCWQCWNVEVLGEQGRYSFIFNSAPSTRSPCTERCVLCFCYSALYTWVQHCWSVRMLVEGEGREVNVCGGWSRVQSRKNSVFLRVFGAAAWSWCPCA
jgi:hypothetical protein